MSRKRVAEREDEFVDEDEKPADSVTVARAILASIAENPLVLASQRAWARKHLKRMPRAQG